MTISGPGWPSREWMMPTKVKIIFAFTKMILTFAGTDPNTPGGEPPDSQARLLDGSDGRILAGNRVNADTSIRPCRTGQLPVFTQLSAPMIAVSAGGWKAAHAPGGPSACMLILNCRPAQAAAGPLGGCPVISPSGTHSVQAHSARPGPAHRPTSPRCRTVTAKRLPEAPVHTPAGIHPRGVSCVLAGPRRLERSVGSAVT